MMRWLLIAAALVGCGNKRISGTDCEVVKKNPPLAVTELGKRYPKDPAKVMQVLENCIAPTGDECERVGAIVKAIPALRPGLSSNVHSDVDYVAVCKEAPPEVRKCYLPSYVVGHAVECRNAIIKMKLAQAEMPKRPVCDGGRIQLVVTGAGAWVITGKDPAARCFGKRAGKGLDAAWLEKELAQFKDKECKPAVEVAGEGDVAYQDLVTAMDTAVKVGLTDTSVVGTAAIVGPIESGAETKAAEHCPVSTIPSEPVSAAGPGSGAGQSPGNGAHSVPSTNALGGAPVVVVTGNEITVRTPASSTGSAAGVVAIKDVASGSGAIEELRKALPAPASANAPLIVQADEATKASVIVRVVETAKAAGYDNVLFAVKNK